MHLFSPEHGFQPLVSRFGWALLHSLWQGVVVVSLLGTGLRAPWRQTAAARHAACLLALGLLTLCTGATLLGTGSGTAALATQASTGPEERVVPVGTQAGMMTPGRP